jgi:hypothetical protein
VVANPHNPIQEESQELHPPRYLIPGCFLTREQWAGPLAPDVDRLVSKPGGVLLISVTVQPECPNYPEVSFAVFDAEERKALRRAIEAARRKREKSHDVTRGDLADAGKGKDSGQDL